MRGAALTGLFLVSLTLAGCTGGGDASGPNATVEFADGVLVRGLVVDVELVPVEGASVYLDAGEWETTSGPDGSFELGPVPAGAYRITAEKPGYAPVTSDVSARAGAGPLTIELTPVAADVPYFETQVYAATIGCAVATPTSRVTCGIINQVTGTTLTPDQSVFHFEIPNEELSTLVAETTWVPAQTFAQYLSFNLLDEEGDQTNCITTACYTEAVGPSPIRVALTPGETWGDPEVFQPFPGEQGHGFYTYLMPPFGTGPQDAVSVYLDQRVDSYLSFFYNRPASDAFSALPDA